MIREEKVDDLIYRFGYQGQYAERDEETGWNHFELREYDPVIGRWMVPDPYRVGWSPYIGMGNNPVNSVDPDGGCPDGNCDDWWHDGETTFLPEFVFMDGAGVDSYVNEWDFGGTYAEYQRAFPEFKNVPKSQASKYWNEHYGESFYEAWDRNVKIEKSFEAVKMMKWFMQAYTTAGTMSLAGLNFSSGATPKNFNFTPRGVNPMAGKSLAELQGIAKNHAGAFRELFGVGRSGAQNALNNVRNLRVPKELTKETLQAYRELIRRVPDPAGTQAIRAKILDALIN